MHRYRTNHRYAGVRDGVRYGPWPAGTEMELSEEDAAWFDRDSPGLLARAEEPDEDEPIVAVGETGATVTLTAGDVVLGSPTGSAPEVRVSTPEVDVTPDGGPADEDGDVVPEGTATEVLGWVAEVPGHEATRARLALDFELGKGDGARSTLVASLERLARGGQDRMHRGAHNRGGA